MTAVRTGPAFRYANRSLMTSRSSRLRPGAGPEHVGAPPARRVLVIGNGGAGKSTLAAALGARLDLPVVHLDRLYWRAGWTPTPRAEWVRTLERLTAADAWILDGNYRGTMAERLARADALVLLDPPTPLCLWRIVRRRFGSRRTADLADGCEERLDIGFVRYVAGYRRNQRRDALAACAAAERAGKRVVHVRGRADPTRIAAALGHGASEA